MAKQTATLRISYAVLKEMLKLPDDVDVLGVPGIADLDGAFPLIIETPDCHIKTNNITARYSKDDDGVKFAGFYR